MADDQPIMVSCGVHGERVATVVCRHLAEVDDHPVGFVENSSEPHDLQAWCAACEEKFEEEGGLTEAFKDFNDFKVVCAVCYAERRARHGPPPAVAAPGDGDWGRWSREALTELQNRSQALRARHGLTKQDRYFWDLEAATMQFIRPDGREARFRLQCIGTTAAEQGTFLWSWANSSLKSPATQDMPAVRAYGEHHDLGLRLARAGPRSRC